MKMDQRSAGVPRQMSAGAPRKSTGAPRIGNADTPRQSTGAPRLSSAGVPKQSAGAPKLYPDLSPFYAPGTAPHRRPSSLETSPPQPPLPPARTQRLQPSAPPLWPGHDPLRHGNDLALLHTSGEDLTVPQEPQEDYIEEEDYHGQGSSGSPAQEHRHPAYRRRRSRKAGEVTPDSSLQQEYELRWEDLVELEPDYDTDADDPRYQDTMWNHLNHHLNVTGDYGLQGLSLEELLELEPDYSVDDPVHHHHDRDNLDRLTDRLNNLNLTATEEKKEKKPLRSKNIEPPRPPSEQLPLLPPWPPNEQLPLLPLRPPNEQLPLLPPRPPNEHLPLLPPPPPPPKNDREFRAWMTWRLQANKLLAAVILTRRGGKPVHVRQSEMMRRKPLTRRTVEKIAQQARGGGGEGGGGGRVGGPVGGKGCGGGADRTSLPACPYVMYGIPRVNLPFSAATAMTTNRP